ncbi:MAG: hypothetical protein AAF442_00030 [Pseudomonadota bacterium]
MKISQQQFGFTAGMLDTTLEARADIAAYYAGAREITNMQSLPQGGLKTRPGMAFVASIPEAKTGARLASFEFSTEQTYLLVFTDRKIHVYREGVKQTTLTTPWTTERLPRIAFTQSLDTMIVVHPDIQPHKVMRQGGHDRWVCEPLRLKNIPKYKFGNAEEPTWSAARGWPRSVYLHEGRLYFGGSRARPQTIWGSNSNDFFDFRVTPNTQLDDDGVEMTLDNDRVSAVEQLYALKDLFALTSGGLFAQSASPVTPKNFFFGRQSELPAAPIRPAELDGSVMFIRRGEDGHHQSLHEIIYDDARQAYLTQDLALLASELLRAPSAIAARMGDETTSANLLFVVNGRDGTLATFHTRRSQEIAGWTLWRTSGQIKDVAVVGTATYLLVGRPIAGQDQCFIERLDDGRAMDGSVSKAAKTPTRTWRGLDHLEGATLAMTAHGEDLGVTTVASGTVTTPHAVTDLQVGLPFDWAVETMPIEAQLSDGTLVGNHHRISRVTLRVKDTASLRIGGRTVAFGKLDHTTMDAPPPSFTGLKTVRLLGWSGGEQASGATIRMTGTSTNPATILSLTAQVAQ